MAPRVVYQFGGYRFDPIDARLTSGDTVIQLTAKAADTLLILARQPNVVVSKDDLMTAVWPDVLVDENNLSQQIAAIRRALSTNGNSVTIETVPRRGYRLAVASTVDLPPAADIHGNAHDVPALAEPARKAVRRARRLRRWAVAAACAIGVTAAAGLLWRWNERRGVQNHSRDAMTRGDALLRQGIAKGAIAELQEAIRLDPGNARAYSSLAHALSRSRFAEPSAVVRPRGPSPSVEAALRSVAVDPECAECRGTLGLFLFAHDWRISEAETHFREALRQAPDQHSIGPAYAMLLGATGRQQEALRQVDRGLERQPFQLSWLEIRASILYFDRRYVESVAAADKALSIDTKHVAAWDWRSKALFQLHRGPEAIQALAQGRFAENAAELERAVRDGGVPNGLRKLLEITDDQQKRIEHSWRRASWRALLDDDDGALDELETAVRARRVNAVNFGVDPVYDGLRRQPRFVEVMKEIGVAPYLLPETSADVSKR